MLSQLCRLGLEVKHLGAAREFYETRLGLVPDRESDAAVEYGVGETTLRLGRPAAVPRGGVHTHYALATTPAAYDDWLASLSDRDPVEFSFGTARSLYVYDPDGNCVEIGDVGGRGGGADGDSGDSDANGDSGADGDRSAPGAAGREVGDGRKSDVAATERPLTGVFEVVLEVTDVERAEAQFRALGFEVIDRGERRPRVRLAGPVDVELWEPQLGIADARGGLHVDLAFRTADPRAAVDAAGPWVDGPEAVDGGLRVRDADGHALTFLTDC